MQLSERAAIVSAIAEGGFHVYPAGKLNELIKKYSDGDTLQGNFDPVKTVEKVRLAYSKYEKKNPVLDEDFNLLCKRLKDFNPVYDFETEVETISKKLPALAKKYFGLNKFESANSKIVEYFFEGFADLYRDADWYAFNVNSVESKEMNVPIGTYYKRSWIVPLYTPWAIIHENIHQMHHAVSAPPGSDRYVAWILEGVADVYGILMFHKIIGNKNRTVMIKRFVEDVQVLDPRKAAYYYGFRIVLELIRNSGLGFMMALFNMTKDDLYSVNWDVLANGVRNGVLPHKLVPYLCSGEEREAFEHKFFKLEKEFSKIFKLDDDDMEVLRLFATMQPPSVITPEEYSAAIWIKKQSIENMEENWVEIEDGKLVQVKEISVDERKKIVGFNEKVVVLNDVVPKEFALGVKELCKKFFIVQRDVGDKVVISCWRGGLPFRMGCGEIRCALDL